MAKKKDGVSFPRLFNPEPFSFTHSAKKTWLACRRLYLLKYLARLNPKRISVPLFMGKYFHKGLEKFYLKEDPEDFIPEIITAMEKEVRKAVFLTPEEEEKLSVATAIIEGMLAAYCRHYSKDLKKWKIVKSEHSFVVPIAKGIEYTGQVDLVVRIGKEHWIVEHKTVGRLDKNYVDRLALDTQITGYAIGARYSLKVPIRGIIYNAARKPMIRMRNGESNEQYTNRIIDDYSKRPDFYFYREQLYRDTSDERQYKQEVSEMIADIQEKLLVTEGKDSDLIASHFYRNTDHCTIRGACPMLPICTRGWNKESAMLYEVRKSLNPELAKEDDSEE